MRDPIESLEPRRLLAGISLRKGVLTIDGDEGDNTVALTQDRQVETRPNGNVLFVNHLTVAVDGEFLGDFSYTNINLVKVKLGAGNDTIIVGKKLLPFDIDGGDGDDTISGGLRGDIIRGGAGVNQLTGSKGNDHFICNAGSDDIIGGLGNDTADFSPFETSLIITIDDVANDAEEGRTGNVHKDIETLIGGGGADFLSAGGLQHAVSITGGSGKDTIIGSDFDDFVHGGPGNDSIRGGPGNDYLNGDGGKDRLFGEGDNDTLNGGGADPKFIPIPQPVPTDLDTVGGGSDSSVDTLDGGVGVDVAIIDPFDIPRNL